MSTSTYWPEPAYPMHPAPPEQKGLGIAAMVLGIVALVLAFIPIIAVLSFLLGPLAVVLGVVASVKRRGRGQGIAGIITGSSGVLVATVGFLIFGALVSSGEGDSQDPGGLEAGAEENAAESGEGEEAGETEDEQAVNQESEKAEGPAAVEDVPEDNETGNLATDADADGGESFTLGEEFQVNDWIVTINGVSDRTATIGDEFFNTQAQGEYIPIELAVTNGGDSAAYFLAGDFVAVDDQDREFSYSSEATIYGASDGAVSILDEINPGNSIEGRLYFDVPADAEITHLEINAGFLSEPVRVSIE